MSEANGPVVERDAARPSPAGPAVVTDQMSVRTGAVPATVQGFTRGFDPRRATATPRHAEITARYQSVYTAVDFAAAVAFVVGSVFFFYSDLGRAADWLFLAGSILFAVRPTVAVVQQLHLGRLPVDRPGTAAT